MEKKIKILKALIKGTKANLKLARALVDSGANFQHLHHQLMNQEAELAAYLRQIKAPAQTAEVPAGT